MKFYMMLAAMALVVVSAMDHECKGATVMFDTLEEAQKEAALCGCDPTLAHAMDGKFMTDHDCGIEKEDDHDGHDHSEGDHAMEEEDGHTMEEEGHEGHNHDEGMHDDEEEASTMPTGLHGGFIFFLAATGAAILYYSGKALCCKSGGQYKQPEEATPAVASV